MTKQERKHPELLVKQKNRRARVAKGCGHKLVDVDQLIERFMMMRQMMQVLGKNPAAMQNLPMFQQMGRMGQIAKNYGSNPGDALGGMMGPGMASPFGDRMPAMMPPSFKSKITGKDKKDKRKSQKAARKKNKKRK